MGIDGKRKEEYWETSKGVSTSSGRMNRGRLEGYGRAVRKGESRENGEEVRTGSEGGVEGD